MTSLYIISGNVYSIDRLIPKSEVPKVLRKDYKSAVPVDVVIRLRPEDMRRHFQHPFSQGKISLLTVFLGNFSERSYQERGKMYKALEKKMAKKRKNILIKLPLEKIPKELLNQNLDGEYFLNKEKGRFLLYRISPKRLI